MTFEDEYRANELSAPIPEGLDTPFAYWLFVMPIAPRTKTEGGIILPDSVRDGENHMNALGRVAAIGEGCFQSAKMREDLLMRTFPKVGDLIRYSGTRNREWLFKGAWFVDIRDDMIRALIREENAYQYKFWR